MNMKSLTRMHPATLKEALSRLDALLRDHSEGYACVAAETPPSVLGAPDPHGDIASAFLALGDICRTIAPTAGAAAAPSAVEVMPDGMVLHFGQWSFGSHPRPVATIARDLETALEIYQRACRREGQAREHIFCRQGEAICVPGVDRADAALFYLTLTGDLTHLPHLPDGSLCLPSSLSIEIEQATRHALETRLMRASAGYRQAAE
jgi:hypothetical protein